MVIGNRMVYRTSAGKMHVPLPSCRVHCCATNIFYNGFQSLNVHKTAPEIERMEEHPDEMDVGVKNRYLLWKTYLTDASDVHRV